MDPIRILHLSDLHVVGDTDPVAALEPLVADLRDRQGGLGFERLDYVVVSGDLTHRATQAEFDRARELLATLCDRFGVPRERCIVAPGNHDLDWDEEVYRYKARRAVDAARLKPGTFKEVGDGVLVRDEAAYPSRFRRFAAFHEALTGVPWPLAPSEQGLSHLFAADGLQFFVLNSAWEIDEHFRARSSVHGGALARALAQAEAEVDGARRAGVIGPALLRIAVWHHPVTGNDKIHDDAFLEQLRKADVRLCLHGHVHEDRADLVGYVDPVRKLHVAGAGSFGAPNRPESMPRLYNVVEISRELRRVRVNTRAMPRRGGAWRGWAVWPGVGPGEQRTFYEFTVEPRRIAPAGTTSATGGGGADGGEAPEFDVFLCHNSRDKPRVKEIARALKARNIRPWLDEWEIPPGARWQKVLERQIETIGAAAVFVGESGFGPWQDLELDAFLRVFARSERPIIPVILPDCVETPKLPLFLAGHNWIDMRQSEPDPIDQLVFGITGKRSSGD